MAARIGMYLEVSVAVETCQMMPLGLCLQWQLFLLLPQALSLAFRVASWLAFLTLGS